MKISELVRQTGVPKETIHYYIREGLLRKPRKSAVNAAEYNQGHVRQLFLIKDLRNNYYLPIPEIKRIVRSYNKQSPSDQAVARVNSRYFRPMERLVETEIESRAAFREATGLSEKWLEKMEDWGIITPRHPNGKVVYTQDDMLIGRLIVDIGRHGFGPADGYNPRDLKPIVDFIKAYVHSGQNKYLAANMEKIAAGEMDRSGTQITEIMSLFFYHVYRKTVREYLREFMDSLEAGAAEKS